MQGITIKNLTKRYGRFLALDEVNLTIGKGITGLLGPNGAGKTTLMDCILGILPFEGSIEWHDSHEKSGYLPQNFQIFDRLTVQEVMEYVCALKNADSTKIPEWLDQTSLLEEAQKKTKELSGGMRRRLGIAQALVGDPQLLILDEPTVGLDPVQRVYVRNLIKSLSKDRTILVSTHIVEDIEQIADHLILLNSGHVIFEGEIHTIGQAFPLQVAELTLSPEALEDLAKKAKVLHVQDTDRGLKCRIAAQVVPEGASVKPATLEDFYFYYVETK